MELERTTTSASVNCRRDFSRPIEQLVRNQMDVSRRNAACRAIRNVGLLLPLLSPALSSEAQTTASRTPACANDDSGLQLPPGFCATVFADGIGHARHMVVAPNGVVY